MGRNSIKYNSLFSNVQVKDGKYGSVVDSATNTWNGMINEVLTDEADLALAILTVTEQRSQVVDFTDYFWPAGK